MVMCIRNTRDDSLCLRHKVTIASVAGGATTVSPSSLDNLDKDEANSGHTLYYMSTQAALHG
jgi:hypothetical protein